MNWKLMELSVKTDNYQNGEIFGYESYHQFRNLYHLWIFLSEYLFVSYSWHKDRLFKFISNC